MVCFPSLAVWHNVLHRKNTHTYPWLELTCHFFDTVQVWTHHAPPKKLISFETIHQQCSPEIIVFNNRAGVTLTRFILLMSEMVVNTTAHPQKKYFFYLCCTQ